MFDTHKNFAIGTVLSAPADAGGQDFILMPGDGEGFANNMPVTFCPPNVQPTADNSEIGYLTHLDGDALTITRAQEGSLPMQVAAGWQVIGSVTAKSLQDIEDSVEAAITEIGAKQPLGNYVTDDELAVDLATKADVSHTQTSSTITDFTEAVQDAVAALLASGSQVSLSYNDAGNSLQISATGADAETMRDTIGSALVGVGAIAITVNDAGDTISISTTATANDTDANLKNRANHTGQQDQSTITNLVADLLAKADDVAVLHLTGGTMTGPLILNNAHLAAGTTTDVIGTALAVMRNGVQVGRIDNNSNGLRIQAQTGTLQLRGSGNSGLAIDGSGNTVAAGSVTATSFIGDGSGLTNLPGSTPSIDSYRTNPAWITDFYDNATTGATPYIGAAIASGTVNQATSSYVVPNHPGVLRLSSSTTTNSGYYYTSDTGGQLIGGKEVFEFIFAPTTLASSTIRFGFLDTITSVDAVDGIYFEVPSTGALVGKTSSNSTRSTTGTSYTVTAATWYRARITVNSNATSVTFALYNEAGTLLWSDTLTTNIPTATGRVLASGVVATNVGTVAVDICHVDYMATLFGTLVR